MPNTFKSDGSSDDDSNDGYNYLSKSANMQRAYALRKQIQDAQDRIPIGGKGFGTYPQDELVPNYKADGQAFDASQNRKEQDAEVYEERAKRSTNP